MDDLGEPGKRCRAELFGLALHPGEFVPGGLHQSALRGVRNRVEQYQVAQPVEQVGAEPARIVPGFHEPVDRAVHGGAVARGERVDHVVDQRDVGDPEQRHRALVGDAFGPRPGKQLVEHAQRVAGGPATGPDHQRVHRGLDLHAFVAADAFEQLAHHARRHQPERVVVGPGPDGGEHLVRFGGGEDEDQVFRRFLDDLQQGVEALRGDHVGLVDDEDPVLRLSGREESPIAQLAGVVDTTVAGRVEFDDVDAAAAFGRERDARVAFAARVGGRALRAVQRAGEDARAGGLAATTRPGEQVRVVDPAGGQRGPQRFGDVVLPDDLSEGRRPVLAVKGERHGGNPTR